MLLLSTAYFAPILYYSVLIRGEQVIMERHENYNKQSYRNRCTIFSANGLLDLTVPVARTKEPKIPVTEVEIAYDMLWQKQHFKTIESAYRRSPFYEYYIDDLMTFFNGCHRYLYDFNMQIMRKVCSLIQISPHVQESDIFMKSGEEITDMRNSIHPKMNGKTDTPHYAQVFAGKWGFQPNLSILDLLFNMGPETKNYLSIVSSDFFPTFTIFNSDKTKQTCKSNH